MEIEINFKTFGTYSVNGIKRIASPNNKIKLKPKEGDKVEIEVDAQDPFLDERLDYHIKEQTLPL